MKKNAIVFLNGKFIPLPQARVSVTDRGFHYGDGLFETILAKNGRPVDLYAHLQRMRKGAKFLKLRIPYTNKKMADVMGALLRRNHLPNALVKVMVTRGPARRIGLSPKLAIGKPTLCIFAWAVHPTYSKKKMYKVIIGSIPRNKTPISGLKSLNYLSHVIAKMEADQSGADEAIFVDNDGHILEGTISNIFIVRRGRLLTPPLSLGVLDGVTRREVLQTARRLRIPTLEKIVTIPDLMQADEAFLAFTSAGVMPVQSVNGKKIGRRCPGPVTTRLKVVISAIPAVEKAPLDSEILFLSPQLLVHRKAID